MKLVDILARELKVWPEGQLTATSSGVDAEVYFQPHNRGDFYPSVAAEDYLNAEVTRAQWQAAVDALKAECNHLWIGWDEIEACELCSATRKIEAWYGNGLPPVGTVCEFKSEGHHSDPEYQWCIYHGKMSCGGYIVEYHHRSSPGMTTCDPFDPALTRFRPFRTPEQIAAEERKKNILQMIDVFGTDTSIWGLDTVREICGHLWEAGYRKQVTP